MGKMWSHGIGYPLGMEDQGGREGLMQLMDKFIHHRPHNSAPLEAGFGPLSPSPTPQHLSYATNNSTSVQRW